jgi:polyisoprenoid-binding protein YceI
MPRWLRTAVLAGGVGLGVGLASVPLGARDTLPWVLRLDPGATRIDFELAATLHTVRGTLPLREGTVRFDPDTGAVAGRVVVDATGAETGNARRDRNMHRDVLESRRHPQIVFEPGRLEVTARTAERLAGTLHGRILLHGASHRVAIPVEAERERPGRGRVTGRFEVPYVAWGLRDPSTLLLRVDDRVTLTFEARGALRAPGSPKPGHRLDPGEEVP